MARIRGVDTSPELKLRSALWRSGLRFRLNVRIHRIRPDIIFERRKIAIFVDGCFWHGCPIHYVMPRTRIDFWSEKLAVNTSRDRNQTRLLIGSGWIVLRYWEHEIRDDLYRIVEEIRDIYRGVRSHQAASRKVVTKVVQVCREGTKERWLIEDLLARDPPIVELRSRRIKQTN